MHFLPLLVVSIQRLIVPGVDGNALLAQGFVPGGEILQGIFCVAVTVVLVLFIFIGAYMSSSAENRRLREELAERDARGGSDSINTETADK